MPHIKDLRDVFNLRELRSRNHLKLKNCAHVDQILLFQKKARQQSPVLPPLYRTLRIPLQKVGTQILPILPLLFHPHGEAIFLIAY